MSCSLYGDWNAKARSQEITWSNRQVWPWSTEWSRAKAYRVLPREPPGHSKHPLLTIPKKGNAKEGSNYCTIAVISHASKVMIKILQAMYKLDSQKAKEPEIKLSASTGSLKEQENSRKTSTSALLTMPKPLTVWITTNCGKFWKRWEYQTTWSASWETCMQVRKQQLELDMEQQTSSK